MPVAWDNLLEEQDSMLVDLLAEKVESICGFKPDPDMVGELLENLSRPQGLEREPNSAPSNKS
jgi:predicted type IV restriction endonuclease